MALKLLISVGHVRAWYGFTCPAKAVLFCAATLLQRKPVKIGESHHFIPRIASFKNIHIAFTIVCCIGVDFLTVVSRDLATFPVTRRDNQRAVHRCKTVQRNRHFTNKADCRKQKLAIILFFIALFNVVEIMATDEGQPNILASLNKAQCRAVTSESDTVAILAGPGSGKTHTLTSRIVWLIQQAGYRPSDIVVATFTVKAAREMKDRIGKALGEECQKKIVLGTFHSIARRYLASYGKHISLDSKFGIADDTDSKAILKRLIKRLGLDLEPNMAKGWISKKKSKGSMTTSTVKTLPNGKKVQENPSLNQCFVEYQEQLANANLLDYDDLLVRCVELLRVYPKCVSNVQTVLVDEYQDTNGIQYDLMKLFAQRRHRITIVGDPDQSIYGWRSAEIKNLHRLLREFPGTDEISLEENYRSSQSILSASLSVIQQDSGRYEKVLTPVHGKGTKPVLRRLRTAADEGDWIVSEIQRAMFMCGGMLKREDCAILLRSASLSRHVESALGKKGIPYRMIGGHKFYERKEIKTLLDYLRVVHQPNNNDAVARIINVPRRGVGEVTIKALLEEAETSERSVWDILVQHCDGTYVMPRLTPAMTNKIRGDLVRIITSMRNQSLDITPGAPQPLIELIQKLITQLGYEAYLRKEYAEDWEQRWASVQEFVNLAADFVMDYGDSDEDALPELEEVEQSNDDTLLGRFLSNIALASDAQKDKDGGDTSAVVTISTIHAAKGLEWPIVFVPCVYDGSIPHSRSEDSDEERRLLYVAMTRAKTLLYLSCPLTTSFGNNTAELSCFVSEFADSAFAEQGPSFDRHVVENISKILGRTAPSENTVFNNLPLSMSTEDDLYPADPTGPKRFNNYGGGSSGSFWGGVGDGSKRQRVNGPSGPSADWKPGYATTMQESSNFTMSTLPGFTTATARQTALDAEAKQEKQSVAAKPGRKAGLKRKHDQHSLLGYVTPQSQRPAAAETKVPPRPPQQSGFVPPHLLNRAARPAIEPTLAQHKISQSPALPRPGASRTTHDSPRNQYACFSSSPPRGSSPKAPQPQEKTAPPAQMQPMFSRPVSIMHNTTFEAGKIAGGARRPTGFGGAPSMDRLRKPFKPLTLNRPPQGNN